MKGQFIGAITGEEAQEIAEIKDTKLNVDAVIVRHIDAILAMMLILEELDKEEFEQTSAVLNPSKIKFSEDGKWGLLIYESNSMGDEAEIWKIV